MAAGSGQVAARARGVAPDAAAGIAPDAAVPAPGVTPAVPAAGSQPAAEPVSPFEPRRASSRPVQPRLAERSLMARIETQPRVRSFLARAVASDRAAQAYLFLGAGGSGKLDAAWALAQALVCENDPVACGACDACVRAARRTHPDIHLYEPESATGYLISQVRDLLSEVALSPIRARRKVYIVTHAEQLRANTANALLKTLEEPPASAVFILLGPSAEVILPTIVSRCQCVPFRSLSADESAEAVMRATGLPRARCRMAVEVAGSPARAAEFLQSAERQEARRRMVRAIDALILADEADILGLVAKPGRKTKARAADGGGAKGGGGRKPKSKPAPAPPEDLMSAIKAPFFGLQEAQEAVLERNADYFSRGAIKQLEERAKRELSARERSGIMEALASARSLLRDVLLSCEGAPDDIVNEDVTDVVERLSAATTTTGAIRALEAVSRAEQRIAQGSSPQLTLEVMLFDIRKAIKCP